MFSVDEALTVSPFQFRLQESFTSKMKSPASKVHLMTTQPISSTKTTPFHKLVHKYHKERKTALQSRDI
jgi:hypothetical protein